MRKLLTLLAATVALALPAAGDGAASTGFATQVSPPSETNATEPYIAVDRSDGTIYVAWQASGTVVPSSALAFAVSTSNSG